MTSFQNENCWRVAALVYNNSAEAMIVFSMKGEIIGVNNAFAELTGWTRAQVIGRTLNDLRGSNNSHGSVRAAGDDLARKGWWAGELWCMKASGEQFLARASVSIVPDDAVGSRRLVALFTDITDEKKIEQTVWRHANLDPLTGLPNRRHFRERLAEEVLHAHERGALLGLMFIDLDRFKDVNDSLGHAQGDKLLKMAAARICANAPADAILARLGGDEFTLVLPPCADRAPIELTAARIIYTLAKPFQLGEESTFVTASAGVAVFPEDALEDEDLLRAADLAMYAAKCEGRNNYRFFNAGMRAASTERAEILRDLHHALDEAQFELHYQPIVTLATGAVEKAEALIRWRHPVRGLVSPLEFIPIAEETGLIMDIGDWVFREAARQLAEWRSASETPIVVSVNASPMQFTSADKRVAALPNILAERGLDGGAMILEITEGVLLNASPDVKAMISLLRESGIEIALDDFGTGYSSLAYLKLFEIGYLKIDRAFVRGLGDGASDLAICEAIIAMAHRLGIAVVAEGIENDTQRQLLAAARCEFGQGYLFARPLPASEFAKRYLKPRRELGPLKVAAA